MYVVRVHAVRVGREFHGVSYHTRMPTVAEYLVHLEDEVADNEAYKPDFTEAIWDVAARNPTFPALPTDQDPWCNTEATFTYPDGHVSVARTAVYDHEAVGPEEVG